MIADAVYDILELSKSVDWFHLREHTTRCKIDSKTGRSTPFVAHNLDTRASVHHWLKYVGVPEKLVLGMMSYGWFHMVDTKCFDHRTHHYAYRQRQHHRHYHPDHHQQRGLFTRGRFTSLASDESYESPYADICERFRDGEWTVIGDRTGSYARAHPNGRAFDDVENIKTKGSLICEMNLGGGGLYALNFDDFHGTCEYGKYPLITALNQQIRGIDATAVENCPLPFANLNNKYRTT